MKPDEEELGRMFERVFALKPLSAAITLALHGFTR